MIKTFFEGQGFFKGGALQPVLEYCVDANTAKQLLSEEKPSGLQLSS